MTVIFSDDFTGTDNDPWNASKWTTSVVGSSGLGVIDIQSNEGRLFHGNASDERSRAIASVASEAVDQEVLVKWRRSADSASALYVWLRASGNWVTPASNGWKPTTGYGLHLPGSSSGGSLIRVVSGADTIIATETIQPLGGTNAQWLRFRVEGSTLSARVWDDGTSEPGTWEITVGDANITAAGRLQFASRRLGGTSAQGIFLDDLSLEDLAIIPLYLSVDDDPASPNDADWVNNAVDVT